MGTGMQLAINTPIVTMIPTVRAGWEAEADPADLVRIAQAADRLGVAYLTCSEHIAITPAAQPAHGTRYYDPLATFGFLAAHTEQLRFLTYAVGLGYHHPLATAKRYGTLDLLSGGRLVLGVGLGDSQAEFDALGLRYDGRGARADDALQALHAVWGHPGPVSYTGEHVAFDGVVVDPAGVSTPPPIWVGGGSPRSFERALRFGTGWMPSFRLKPDELRTMLTTHDRPDDFAVVLSAFPPVDPVGDPAGTRAALEARAELGANAVVVSVAHRSLEEFLDQVEALVTLAPMTPTSAPRQA